MRKASFRGLIILMILTIGIGFYLRSVSAFGTRVVHPFSNDARDYYMYAYNLRYKQTYSRDISSLADIKQPVTPDAVRSPGYPLFLSIFADGPPAHRTVAKIVFAQMILSTLVLVLAFCLYNHFLSGYWSIAALLLTALSPHLIVANSYILTETLFCMVLVLGALQLSKFFMRPSRFQAAAGGLVLGAASLIRPGLQYFPLVFAGILIGHYGMRKGLNFAAVLLLAYLSILSPWIIRNLTTLHLISDDTLKINFLHHGMYPEFKFEGIDESYKFPYRYDPRANEISKSTASVLYEIARRFRQEPMRHLKWYIIGKPDTFWSWNTVQGIGDAFFYRVYQTPYRSNMFFKLTHRLMYHLHWPLVFLGAIGCFLSWLPSLKGLFSEQSIQAARVISALILYFTAIHMIGAPFPRYSIPLRPFLYGMAIFCLLIFYTAYTVRKANKGY